MGTCGSQFRLVRHLCIHLFGLAIAVITTVSEASNGCAVSLIAAAFAADAPRQGGIFQKAHWAPPRSLDYCRDADGFGAEAWTLIYEGLLSFDYKPGENFH